MRLFYLLTLLGHALCASIDWRVLNGGLMYKNQTFLIKGYNHFGGETCDFVAHGFHVHPMTWYLDFAKENNFNLVRYPISEDWVIHGFETQKPPEWAVSADPSLKGLTSLQILDKYVDELWKRGMFILFDMHRLECGAQSHEVWYSLSSGTYTTKTFFSAWKKVIERYQNHPAFHAIDLLNEPRGVAQWGIDPRFSWNLFVESAFAEMDYYNGIIYVEGTSWGRDFSGSRNFPIDAPKDRIVYSVHCYGPSVAPVASMDISSLHADWTNVFGFLIPSGKTVIVGEFGGRYIGADRDWQNMYVDYLIDLRIAGIYWCLNPNSGDTGGLLSDDWTTPQWDKLHLLKRLQPYPSVVETRRNLRVRYNETIAI